MEVEAGAGGKGRVLQIVRLVARARRHARVLCQLDDLLQGRAACMSGSSLCFILLWEKTIVLHKYNNSTRSVTPAGRRLLSACEVKGVNDAANFSAMSTVFYRAARGSGTATALV